MGSVAGVCIAPMLFLFLQAQLFRVYSSFESRHEYPVQQTIDNIPPFYEPVAAAGDMGRRPRATPPPPKGGPRRWCRADARHPPPLLI